MCRSFPREKLVKLGVATSAFYGVLTIICIVIAGVDYQQTDFRWTSEGTWRYLASLQVGVVVVVFFFCILGIVLLLSTTPCRPFQILYIVFEFFSIVLSLSISIVALVAGAISKNDLTNVCKKEYKGIFSHFKELDDLISLADEKLCSNYCPCTITNYSAYEDIIDFYSKNDEYYTKDENIIYLDNPTERVKNFNDCNTTVKEAVMQTFTSGNGKKRYFGNIKINYFTEFWGRIEKKFHCNGWCQVEYNDSQTKKRKQIKYVFSDVNGGVVQNRGCMHRLIDWLPKVINTFGSVLLIISVIMIVNFVFIVSVFCQCHQEVYHFEKEEPHHHLDGSKQKLAESSEFRKEQKDNQSIELKSIKPEVPLQKDEEKLDA